MPCRQSCNNHLYNVCIIIVLYNYSAKKLLTSILISSHKISFISIILLLIICIYRGGIVDCQERGLRESDWNDPIDSREEGTQKYATSTSAANAKIAAMHTLSTPIDPIIRKGTKSAVSTSSTLLSKAASDFGSKSGTTKTNNNKTKAVDIPLIDPSLEAKKNDDDLRKMILNAPRRITKIESSIAKHEIEIKKIDDEMLTVSTNKFRLLYKANKKVTPIDIYSLN